MQLDIVLFLFCGMVFGIIIAPDLKIEFGMLKRNLKFFLEKFTIVGNLHLAGFSLIQRVLWYKVLFTGALTGADQSSQSLVPIFSSSANRLLSREMQWGYYRGLQTRGVHGDGDGGNPAGVGMNVAGIPRGWI